MLLQTQIIAWMVILIVKKKKSWRLLLDEHGKLLKHDDINLHHLQLHRRRVRQEEEISKLVPPRIPRHELVTEGMDNMWGILKRLS